MILKYRNIPHDANSCNVKISKRAVFSQRGIRMATRETWSIEAMLRGATVAEVTTEIAELQNLYAVNGGHVGLYENDGTTLTAHYINSAQTMGGVRVTDFDFPKGDKTEYVNRRTVNITLEADFPDTSTNLLFFQESITVQGGGPRYVFLQPLNGPPVKQMVAQQTTCRVVQSGSALGFRSYPSPPPPISLTDELADQRTISNRGPRMTGNYASEFGITWTYYFESVSPLIRNPTVQ